MTSRQLLQSSGTYYYIPIGSIIVFICLFVWLVVACSSRRKQQREAQALSQQLPEMTSDPAPSYSTPPVYTNYAPPAPPYSNTYPGVVQTPTVDVYRSMTSTPFSRQELDSMSVNDLRIVKQRLGMAQMPAMTKDEFIDMALAVQLSLQETTKPATPSADASPQPSWGRIGSSSRNPKTGLLECGMCFDPMGGAAEKPLAVPPCGHAFCYDCLVRVATEAGAKCPTCRRTFNLTQITKVYS